MANPNCKHCPFSLPEVTEQSVWKMRWKETNDCAHDELPGIFAILAKQKRGDNEFGGRENWRAAGSGFNPLKEKREHAWVMPAVPKMLLHPGMWESSNLFDIFDLTGTSLLALSTTCLSFLKWTDGQMDGWMVYVVNPLLGCLNHFSP